MVKKGKNLVVGIYYHPEVFPPTLNAVTELSHLFDEMSMVYRPNLHGDWTYPTNLREVPSGSFMPTEEQERSSVPRKIGFFLRFVRDLFQEIRSLRPSVVLLYDPMALFAFWVVRPWLRKSPAIWYHNHDVADPALLRKYSLGWCASRVEQRFFRKLDLFTLPTAERLRYFPMKDLKGAHFIVPNYPSISFYGRFHRSGDAPETLRLLFQGRVAEGHGLEDIIPVLGETVSGHRLQLVLKGFYSKEYRAGLEALATEHGVSDRLEFIGFSPYREVPKVTASCQVGIAIFAKKDIMNDTLGKASNKIYEYAAAGLPVLYLKGSGVGDTLDILPWAVAVELEKDSILEAISRIAGTYATLSEAAYVDFCKDMNFERHFSPVSTYVKEHYSG